MCNIRQQYNDEMHDATKYLMAALEADMYGNKRKQPYAGLMTVLTKLSIKSAMLDNRMGPLKMESLSAVLKSATFDDKHLKLWKKPKK